MQETKVYQAAMYVRLSKEDVDVANSLKSESGSIQNQKRIIRDYVQDKPDIEIVKEYEDDGYSGSDFNRPGFRAMMEDIKSGDINCVIVKDLSRFGREYIDSGKYIERIFPMIGVRFIAINDNIDRGSEKQDDIVVPFKNLMNDAYCRDISIKIRTNLEAKRKAGQYTGPYTPYGYLKDEKDKNRLVIDRYAAGIVQDIFRMKIQGMSNKGIADYLNDHGVLSPLEYKHSIGIRLQVTFQIKQQAKWDAVSVKRILENEIYTGTLVQGKRTTPNYKVKKVVERPKDQWVRIENNHEPIVSGRDFDLVQRLLSFDTRLPATGSTVYPLAGLAVCAGCGSPMVKVDVPAKGRKYTYYVCSGSTNKNGCSPHRISKQKLEKAVFSLLKKHIQVLVDMEEFVKYIKDTPFKEIEIKKLIERKDILQKEVRRWNDLRNGLYEDLKDGIITKEEYEELRSGFTDKRDKVEQEIKCLDSHMEEVIAENSEKYNWMAYFTEHRDIRELTRTMAVELIRQIRVVDKKNIEVIFSFDDEFHALKVMMEENDAVETVSKKSISQSEGMVR